MTIEQGVLLTLVSTFAVLAYHAGRQSQRIDTIERDLREKVTEIYKALDSMNRMLRAVLGRRAEDHEGES